MDDDVVSDYMKRLLANSDETSAPVQGVQAGMSAGMPSPDLVASLDGTPSGHAFPTISQMSQGMPQSQPSADSSNVVKQAIAQKYGFGPKLDSNALQSAMDESKQNVGNAMTGEGANTIGWALARQPGKADNQFYQQQIQHANQPVADIQALRQAKIQDLGAEEQMGSADASSSTSKAVQDAYIRLGFPADSVRQLSANDLKQIQSPVELKAKIDEQKQVAQARIDQQTALRQMLMGNKTGTVDMKADEAFKTGLKTNEAYKEADTTANTADSLVNLVNQALSNKTSAQSLSTELANFASKGKRLHSATVEAFAHPNSDMMTRISQAINKSENGTITPDVAKDIVGYLNSEKNSALTQKQTVIQSEADDFSRIHGRMPKLYDASAGQGGSQSKASQGAVGHYPPGSMVNVKGKQYRVGADGDSLEAI